MKKMFILAIAAFAAIATCAETPQSGIVSIQKFGVLPSNSAHQNKINLQKAIDWATASGSALFVDPVQGGYEVESGLLLRRNVNLIGVHGPLGRGSKNPDAQGPTGSLFVIRDANAPFISVESSTSIKGIQFWYPEQELKDPAKVIEYPATIKMASEPGVVECVTLESLSFYGEYTAMDFRSGEGQICEQILFEHCYGFPFSGQFIAIDRCYDIPRILHCHVNPANMREFGMSFTREISDYIVGKKTFTYWVDHTDNAQFMDLFTFGVYGGIYLGGETYGQLTNFNLDCVAVGIYKKGNNAFNRNWQIAQGSIIANIGDNIEDIHPIVIEGGGHTALTNVECFSGNNPAVTNQGKSWDYMKVIGNQTATISVYGSRMRNYVSDNPFTVENPKASIRATDCVDKNEKFFDFKL